MHSVHYKWYKCETAVVCTTRFNVQAINKHKRQHIRKTFKHNVVHFVHTLSDQILIHAKHINKTDITGEDRE